MSDKNLSEPSGTDTRPASTGVSRRRVLSTLALGGGAAMIMPERWVKPVINAVVLPAHAEGTAVVIDPVTGTYQGKHGDEMTLQFVVSNTAAGSPVEVTVTLHEAGEIKEALEPKKKNAQTQMTAGGGLADFEVIGFGKVTDQNGFEIVTPVFKFSGIVFAEDGDGNPHVYGPTPASLAAYDDDTFVDNVGPFGVPRIGDA